MTTTLYTTDSLASAYAFLRDVRASFEGLDWVLTIHRDFDGTYRVVAG